ncbi:The BTB (BR-C, ttk and bab)/POZ (Pox virus and Zinc finger) domain [Ceratobasidium sp. AG-Ba]|nr:The BTB (BR-C, ttk and bab)/POZ (Pox virus and Zinc finger) domain [Ceratobasidium sp. AG-Ba]
MTLSKELALANSSQSPLATSTGTSNQRPGDTIITTRDGAMFHVHFDILAFASPVFCKLLTPCSIHNAFFIDEASSEFFCFMKLAYSRDVPVLSSFLALDNALHISTKYELVIMKKLLRGTLSDPSSSCFIEKDPISSFGIALAHNFQKELATASRLLVQCINIRDPQALELLRADSTGTQILNMLALRHAKLADSLLSQERGIVIVEDPNVFTLLSCESCCSTAKSLGLKYVRWMVLWAQSVYETLVSSCITTQGRLFGVGYILDITTRTPGFCAECRSAIVAHHWTYETWITGVKDQLFERLTTELEAQIGLGSNC